MRRSSVASVVLPPALHAERDQGCSGAQLDEGCFLRFVDIGLERQYLATMQLQNSRALVQVGTVCLVGLGVLLMVEEEGKDYTDRAEVMRTVGKATGLATSVLSVLLGYRGVARDTSVLGLGFLGAVSLFAADGWRSTVASGGDAGACASDSRLLLGLGLLIIVVHTIAEVRSSCGWVLPVWCVGLYLALSLPGVLCPEGPSAAAWNAALLSAVGFCAWRGRYRVEQHERWAWRERRHLTRELEQERQHQQQLHCSLQLLLPPEQVEQISTFADAFCEGTDGDRLAYTRGMTKGLEVRRVSNPLLGAVGDAVAVGVGRTWNFDLFSLDPRSALGTVGASCLDLAPDHGVDVDRAEQFFARLGLRYRPNPYHNALHAAQVCHLSFCLLWQLGLELDPQAQVAALVAALGHDAGHTGMNNGFLIASRHPLATVYNDVAVQENYHSATTMTVLEQDADGSMLRAWTVDERKKLRSLVVRLILDTDMARHFTILQKLRDALEEPVQWADTNTLHLGLACVVKAADLGHAALEWRLHEHWSRRVQEEFFRQGDAEDPGPISALCDRSKVHFAKSQVGFCEYLCQPFFTALDGLTAGDRGLAGVLQGLRENQDRWEVWKEEENQNSCSTAAESAADSQSPWYEGWPGRRSGPAHQQGQLECFGFYTSGGTRRWLHPAGGGRTRSSDSLTQLGRGASSSSASLGSPRRGGHGTDATECTVSISSLPLSPRAVLASVLSSPRVRRKEPVSWVP